MLTEYTFIAYSVGESVAESEYLFRELGVSVKNVSEDYLGAKVLENFSLGKRTLLLFCLPEKVDALVTKAPQDSIILLSVGDEDYSPARHALYLRTAVHSVYRNYSITTASARLIAGAAVSFLWECRFRPSAVFWLVRSLGSARKIMQRAKRLSSLSTPKIRVFPLGYTNKFALAYADKHSLDATDSLLGFGAVLPRGERNFKVAFLGRAGNPQRRAMIRHATRFPNSSVVSDDSAPWLGAEGFGPSAYAYIELLENSELAIIPPGTISNESYRLLESAICGSHPLGVAVSLRQGCLPEPTLAKDVFTRSGLALKRRLREKRYNADNVRKLLILSIQILQSVREEIQADEGMTA